MSQDPAPYIVPSFDVSAHLQRELSQIEGLIEQINQQIGTAVVQLQGLGVVRDALKEKLANVGETVSTGEDQDQLKLELDIR